MKKIRKLIFGISRLIKFYGPKIFFNVLIFEIFYLIKNYNREIILDESNNREYTSNKSKIYNSPASPTPYYFIFLLFNKLKSNYNLKKYKFFDFGCGSCRVLNFFYLKKIHTTGIDIVKSYKQYLINKDEQIFLNFDIRKKHPSKYLKNNNLILYFYEPFEIKLVLKIIKSLSQKKIICILVNYNLKKIDGFKIIYKLFPSKYKGICIFTNH